MHSAVGLSQLYKSRRKLGGSDTGINDDLCVLAHGVNGQLVQCTCTRVGSCGDAFDALACWQCVIGEKGIGEAGCIKIPLYHICCVCILQSGRHACGALHCAEWQQMAHSQHCVSFFELLRIAAFCMSCERVAVCAWPRCFI